MVLPWNPVNQYKYTIYLESGTIKALNDRTGNVDFTGTNIDTVLQSCMNLKGDIYIKDGIYPLSAGFAGLNFTNFTHITCDRRKTEIQIPNGYSGYVFGFPTNCQGCVVDGGIFYELSTTGTTLDGPDGGGQQHLWDFARFTGNSVQLNGIRNVRVLDVGTCIHFKGTTTGDWWNSNFFEDMEIWWPVKAVWFEWQPVGFIASSDGANRNYFNQIYANGWTWTTDTIKDCHGNGNTFISFNMSDLLNHNAGAKYLTNTVNAAGTQVYSGILTNNAWSNSGTGTVIFDSVLRQVPDLNWAGTIVSGNSATSTAAASGAFGPKGYIQIQVSGANVKIPFMAV